MTAELRYIFFSNVEFTRALRELGARCGEDVPTSTIVGIQGIDEKTGEVTLDYGPNGTVTLAREKVAAALILYCRLKNIPLPAEGQKSLTLSQGRIVLVISIPDKARQNANSKAEGTGAVPAS
jgi:hypothetical protein